MLVTWSSRSCTVTYLLVPALHKPYTSEGRSRHPSSFATLQILTVDHHDDNGRGRVDDGALPYLACMVCVWRLGTLDCFSVFSPLCLRDRNPPFVPGLDEISFGSLHYLTLCMIGAMASNYITTTIEKVRRQTYNVPTSLGVKRSHKTARSENAAPARSHALEEISGNLQNGFKRPRLEDFRSQNRFKASGIKEAGGIVEGCPSEYTQRKMMASTPNPSQNPLLSLKHPSYGLPSLLVENFSALGINSIYPWQSSCLLGRGLLTGEKNLVYTAPTGGGKSLVADILMLKRAIENKKAILVLPYVALVQEKLKWLRRAVEGVDKRADSVDSSRVGQARLRNANDHRSIRVVGYFGGSTARTDWADVDIAVCTIEKAGLD